MSSFTSRISNRGSRGSRFVRVHVARRTAHGVLRCVAIAAALHTTVASRGSAQQPPPAPTPVAPAPPLPGYRAPQLALVQPGPGASVPLDRPAVVFRFAPGEPFDPLDLASFRVSVDGRDRTRGFQVTATEAWGSLALPGETLAQGERTVVARICSSRGACASAIATVAVVAPTVGLISAPQTAIAAAASVAASAAATAAAIAATRLVLP